MLLFCKQNLFFFKNNAFLNDLSYACPSTSNSTDIILSNIALIFIITLYQRFEHIQSNI